MTNTLRHLRLVIASPSDVDKERDSVEQSVNKLNRMIFNHKGFHLDVSRWETDSAPNFHILGPQGRIDEELDVASSDFIVGLFWSRFGSPTMGEKSGTAHELKTAFACWQKNGKPQIMVYFCTADLPPPRTVEEGEQRTELVRFQQNFPKEGTWWTYKDRNSFSALFEEHLSRNFNKLISEFEATEKTSEKEKNVKKKIEKSV